MSSHFKDMSADVRVGVRSLVVAVQVESAVVLVLVVIAADVQHHARSVVVAVIAPYRNTDRWNGNPVNLMRVYSFVL